MSYKEIAQTLNTSTKTVDYRIQQALKLLRKELKEFLSFALIFLAAQYAGKYVENKYKQWGGTKKEKIH